MLSGGRCWYAIEQKTERRTQFLSPSSQAEQFESLDAREQQLSRERYTVLTVSGQQTRRTDGRFGAAVR
jgi:hypothetical protein